MEKAWVLLLAEAEAEPSEEFYRRFNGAVYLGRRLWVWWGNEEEMRGKAFVLGHNDIYGTFYIRMLRAGSRLADLHNDPAVIDVLDSRLRQYEDFYIRGQDEAVMTILDWATKLGLREIFERRGKALELSRHIYTYLAAGSRAPIYLKEGKVYLQAGSPIPIETKEEAERIGQVYRWANLKGVRLNALKREGEMLIFEASNVYRVYTNSNTHKLKAELPLEGVGAERILERARAKGRPVGVIIRDDGNGIQGEVLSLKGIPEGIRILYHRD